MTLSFSATIENPHMTPITSLGLVPSMSAPTVDFKIPVPKYSSLDAYWEEAPRQRYAERGTVVLLGRHAQSFGNAQEIYQGDFYSPVTPAGFKQADAQADLLRRFEIGAKIYCSDTLRVVQSVTRVVERLGLSAELYKIPDLREVHPGILDARFKKRNSREIEFFLKRMKDKVVRDDYRKEMALTDDELDLILQQMESGQYHFRQYGELAGLSEDAYREELRRQGKRSVDFSQPNGVSYRTAYDVHAARLDETIFSRLGNGIHFVNGHGLKNRIIMLKLLGIPLVGHEQLFSFRQENACLNVLWRSEAGWELHVLNESPGIVGSDGFAEL